MDLNIVDADVDGDTDDEQQAMAQAMGFSSFGAQSHPHKKRKYNPQADASSVGDQTPEEATTGSNSTPLGQRALPQRPQTGENADEIDLEDDEEDGDGEQDQEGRPPVSTPSTTYTLEEQGVPRPAGLPARPAPGTGFVGGGGSHAASRHNQGGGGGATGRRGNHGSHNDGRPWHEGYYDSLSNENPWERLEKAMGLESKGTWLARES